MPVHLGCGKNTRIGWRARRWQDALAFLLLLLLTCGRMYQVRELALE